MSGSKAKRWCFTSFNVDNEPNFDSQFHEYLVFGRETCPDTNRKHLQGFVCFKNRTTLPGCRRFCPGAHFERARGTPEEASEYCKKDGDFSEFGTLPTTTGRPSTAGDILLKAEAGDIEWIKANHPGQYLRYKANILSSIKFSDSVLDNSCGVWICGESRTGKDYCVRKFQPLYQKNLNKWWDGYRNEKAVLLSDIEPNHASWLGYLLKIWTDCYPFNAEIKGGSMIIRPQKIYCTSNYRLDECFTGQVYKALKCRMTVVDIFDLEHPVVEKRMCVRPSNLVYDLLIAHGEDVSTSEPLPEEENIAPPEEDGLPPQEAGLPPVSSQESGYASGAE